MTSIREDLIKTLREYEEEEKRQREQELKEKEEKIRQIAQNDVKSMYEPYLEDDKDKEQMLQD